MVLRGPVSEPEEAASRGRLIPSGIAGRARRHPVPLKGTLIVCPVNNGYADR